MENMTSFKALNIGCTASKKLPTSIGDFQDPTRSVWAGGGSLLLDVDPAYYKDPVFSTISIIYT
ncbi:hypothetical protein SLEP1_g10133 [Rubroshorea leprosula]|uniref:Uncharacterized protein n=1 Tax=Rubroshorea leprosula TaxID=152421 RepID=A0AAV5I749_9ROSI|nr:hypothetical protein SLEP1_g10133 [Rubroshorea leprosula]